MKQSLWFGCAILLAVWISCQQAHERNEAEKGAASSQKAAHVTVDTTGAPEPWELYSYDERRGKRLFEHYCIVCHGQQGEGDGFNSYTLDPRPKSFADSTYMSHMSDAFLAKIIGLGGRGVNRSVLMPAYQNTLSTDQISYLVKYIRTFLKRRR